MTYPYNISSTIRLAEIRLLTLDELKLVLAEVDSPSQAREMAAHHSLEAAKWVNSVILACNHIHSKLKCN